MTRLPYKSLVEAVIKWVESEPHRVSLTFLSADQSTIEITYERLHHDASSLAQFLYLTGLRFGEIVILFIDHSYDLVVAFLGAIYAGAVPTIFPYLPARTNHGQLSQLNHLLTLTKASWILTQDVLKSVAAEGLNDRSCRLVTVDQRLPRLDSDYCPYNPAPQDIAYLQLSSGTTGPSNGVMVSQQALLNHIEAGQFATSYTQDDVSISWIPLYHDMGLISQLLMPLCIGGSAVLLSPRDWSLDPKSLLWAIHSFGGTLSCMPNFAFQHCTRLIRDRDLHGLDLSSLRILTSGGETVHLETIHQFKERFIPYGFRPEALMVSYGLAENVAAVTCTPTRTEPNVDWISIAKLRDENHATPVTPSNADARSIVSCGFPISGTVLEVVDEGGVVCPDRVVGEIRLQGSSLFSGYYHQPDLTTQTMRDGWLYTGDLGYISAGQLYVCGRQKDVIIARGQNIYPDSIETIATVVLSRYAGHAVAFGISDTLLGTEMPILVCEYRRLYDTASHADLIQKIRQRVQQELDITLMDIRLVQRGWVKVTTSGKVSRTASRDKYLAAGWRPPSIEQFHLELATAQSRSDLEAALSHTIATVTGVTPLAPPYPPHGSGVGLPGTESNRTHD